jgi:O-antigen/teichoic acid export membrane protein
MNISRNVLWNACGAILPLVVGVAVIPAIVRNIGVERFGILSLIWALIGYFSVFDLGLSRTLTKVTADRVGTPAEAEVPTLITTTVILVAAVSATFGLIIAATAPLITRCILHISAGDAADTSGAIVWLAISVPFVLLSTVLFGALEGLQKFEATNSVRLPLGILTFLVPYGISRHSAQLSEITAALLVLRAAVFFVLIAITIRIVPRSCAGMHLFRRDQLKQLLTFGGWLTVSNIVGPLLVYFDRFMIALVLGSAAVAYYTVPFDALFRVLVLPTAIQGVLFPAFASLSRQSDNRVAVLFRRSSESIFLVMVPTVLAVVLLGRIGLKIWMGSEFASRSFLVAEIMSVGLLFNAFARTPIMLVQGYGRAKWTGVLHALELPFYGVALWGCLKLYAINGAALAWTARVAIDCVVLYAMAARLEQRIRSQALRDLLVMLGVSIGAVVLGYLIDNTVLRGLIVLAVSVPCGLVLLGSVKAAIGGVSRQVGPGVGG